MKAILLAAGFGTRLRPLTDRVPKCLVPIDGKALLDVWLSRLADAGVGPFLVNTHYMAGAVDAHISAGPYRDRISLCHEEQLLGTAGTLLANIDFLGDEDGLLIHADNWCLADLAAFIEAHRHRPAGCVMTMMSFRSATPSSCGILELNDQDVVVDLHEKVSNPPGNHANGAVYLLDPEFQQLFRRDYATARDFSTEVLPDFVGRIFAWETDAPFLDIGTPETYAQACSLATTLRESG